MGSWIEHVAKSKSWTVHYDTDTRFNFHGCDNSDIVSHYIKPVNARCMFAQADMQCCSGAEARQFVESGVGVRSRRGGRAGAQGHSFLNA